MTDIPNAQQLLATSPPRRATDAHGQADKAFLRRILFGLIAATVFSGAITVGLTTQHDAVERFQVASAHGPA